MKVNKKGALELSINTIIIIVLGVTLLSLGLIFVNRVFGNVEELGGSAFERAQSELEKISGNVDEYLTVVPSKVKVEQGSSTGVYLLVTNLGEETLTGLEATLISYQEDVECIFLDKTESRSVRDLESGEQDKIEVLIESSNTASLGTKTCDVEVPGLPGDNEKGIIIEIEKWL